MSPARGSPRRASAAGFASLQIPSLSRIMIASRACSKIDLYSRSVA